MLETWGRNVVRGAVVAVLVALACPASAQYFRRPVSEIDPRIMLIDEKAVLGAKLDPATAFVDQDGKDRSWGEFLGKPLVLVLSYYSCDGSCSIINSNLAELLKGVDRIVPGEDFRVLTLSFDRHDSLSTTGAFRKHLSLAGPLADNWTFATFKNEADIAAQTEKIGFKFFWVPEDKLFLHPGAFLFFSPEGRLIRVLYQQEVAPGDVQLAVLDARQGQFRPTEIINFALSLCYSYNYHDGKYRLSIPIFVMLGAFLFGITLFAGSAAYYRFTNRKSKLGEMNHAKSA